MCVDTFICNTPLARNNETVSLFLYLPIYPSVLLVLSFSLPSSISMRHRRDSAVSIHYSLGFIGRPFRREDAFSYRLYRVTVDAADSRRAEKPSPLSIFADIVRPKSRRSNCYWRAMNIEMHELSNIILDDTRKPSR